jgi:hypothetical protein
MWQPVNRHWAFVDQDINRIRTRLPSCLVSAKTTTCVLRLLSLIEEMDRVMHWNGWSNAAYEEKKDR